MGAVLPKLATALSLDLCVKPANKDRHTRIIREPCTHRPPMDIRDNVCILNNHSQGHMEFSWSSNKLRLTDTLEVCVGVYVQKLTR